MGVLLFNNFFNLYHEKEGTGPRNTLLAAIVDTASDLIDERIELQTFQS